MPLWGFSWEMVIDVAGVYGFYHLLGVVHISKVKLYN
jgi:hypothetical protein